ncbi:MAG: L-lactate dehydrogenase [Candidatus Omnitrophota bacterium]
MDDLRPKVSIIGAGNVGIRYAYALMMQGLCRSLVIVDLNKQHAEAEVMDLASGMPYFYPVQISAGDYTDLSGSDLVVITAGAKQKAGQDRISLLKDNIEVFKKIIPLLTKYAAQAVWLVVTNPVDILSYATYKISGKDSKGIIGSGTVLDSARMRFLLSKHCNIDARNIHAYILGEHGDSEFAAWSTALIGGTFLKDYCPVCNRCRDYRQTLDSIFTQTRDFAYKIIENKGETSYGIGLALARITEAVLKDENSVLPVSSYVRDYYGVEGIYLSLPAVLNKGGLRDILRLKLNEEEVGSLQCSAAKLRQAIQKAGL